jgi:hypothetical protein
MKIWDKVGELMEMIDDIDNDKHRDFIVELHENLDPHNVEEELSQKQIDFLETIYDLYMNDNEDAFEDWND